MDWLSSAAQVVASFWEAKTPQNVFPKNLQEFIPVFNYVQEGLTLGTNKFPHTNAQADALVEYIHQTGAALGYSEEQGGDLFSFFLAYEGVDVLVNGLLAFATLERVRAQLLQTLSILIVNAKDPAFAGILQSGAYNRLLRGQPELPTDDCAALYVHALKRVALRMNSETAELLLMPVGGADAEAVCFPLMTEAARLVLHPEQLACTGARATCLSILQIDNLRVRAAAMQVFEDELLPLLAVELRSAWAAASAALRGKDAAGFRSAMEHEEDVIGYLADLLGLGLPWVTQAIADGIVAEVLLPQLFVLAARHRIVLASRPQHISPFEYVPEPPPVLPSPSMWSVFKDVISPRLLSPSPTNDNVQDDEESCPDELDERLAVRSIAVFLQRMRQEEMAGIMVPTMQLLLWPAVPEDLAQTKVTDAASFKEARRSFVELSAGHSLEDRALVASEAQSLSMERQKCWRLALRGSNGLRLPGQGYVPNPFLPALQAMLGAADISSIGDEASARLADLKSVDESVVPALGMASWILSECRAALYPAALQDAGLLPPLEAWTSPTPKTAPGTVTVMQQVEGQMQTETEGVWIFEALRKLLRDGRCS